MCRQNYLYSLITDNYPKQGPWACGKYNIIIVSAIKAFLCPLSLIYALVVRILIFVYGFGRCRLNCKVISVGNITLGGTGKTALVEFIARYLKQRGHKAAILTRGYKRAASSLEPRASSPETMGDEPYMLKMNLGDIPVIVDNNRIRAAQRAIREYGVDTVILDDGFQQWRIVKDLDIVAIDAINPFGNRHILPRGILREPISCLKRSDVFVLTKTSLAKDPQRIRDYLGAINPNALVFDSTHKAISFYSLANNKETLTVESLEGKRAALFSGIGDPGSFEDLTAGLGIKIGLAFRFRDHYNYSKKDIEDIIQQSKDKNIDVIITTQKDAVRIAPLPITHGSTPLAIGTESSKSANYPLPIIVLRIELAFKDEQGFCNRLLKLYSV